MNKVQKIERKFLEADLSVLPTTQRVPGGLIYLPVGYAPKNKND